MRNICKCDVCGLMGQMPTTGRLPDTWVRFEGNDFCKDCYKEYRKRYKKMWLDFVKEKITRENKK